MSEDSTKWLDEFESKFKVVVSMSSESKSLLETKVTLRDPYEKGASFSVYFDKSGSSFALEMDDFHFGWFNVAEGYSSEDILKAAEAILEGNYRVDHTLILRKPRACFNTSRGLVCGRFTGSAFREPAAYRKIVL